EEKLARGDSAAAWRDLATADRLGGQSDSVVKLRPQYAERAPGEGGLNLVAGQTQVALAELDQLQQLGMFGETVRLYRQVSKLLQEAERSAAHGHFSVAAATISQARDLIGKQPTEEGTMEIARQLELRREQMAGKES